MNDGWAQEFLERIEVSVAVKERMLSMQTKRRNQAIDRLSHEARPIVFPDEFLLIFDSQERSEPGSHHTCGVMCLRN
jgi:hypothetical protein